MKRSMSGTNPRVIRHNQPPGRGRVEIVISLLLPQTQGQETKERKNVERMNKRVEDVLEGEIWNCRS